MAVLHSAPHINSDRFSYNPQTQTFACEESDLHGIRYCGRIYDDAADEGMWLVSHKTGKKKPFALFHTHVREGEITHWEYHEIDPKTGLTVFNGVKIAIFND